MGSLFSKLRGEEDGGRDATMAPPFLRPTRLAHNKEDENFPSVLSICDNLQADAGRVCAGEMSSHQVHFL